MSDPLHLGLGLSSRDFASEISKEQTNKTPRTSAQQKVSLAKDSLEVPLEVQMSVNSQEAEPGSPFLPPPTYIRLINDRQMDDSSRQYYQQLRLQLSPTLQEKLTKEETQVDWEDRDPDFIDLDKSLKFEAHLLALRDRLSETNSAFQSSLGGNLSSRTYLELLSDGSKVAHFLHHFLADIGQNNPNYDKLMTIYKQIKEALTLLDPSKEALSRMIENKEENTHA